MVKKYIDTGMDTNIIGRMRIQGIKEPEKPFFTYLGVLRLSEPSHSNTNGIGLADFTTEALVQSIDQTLVDGALKMLRLDDLSKTTYDRHSQP